MGGFLGALTAVGEGIANQSSVGQAVAGALDPTFNPAQKNQQNLLSSLVNRYKPGIRTAPGANVPSNYDQNVPGVNPAHMTDESNPTDPNRYEGDGMQGPDMQGGGIPNQNQWQNGPSGPSPLGSTVGLGAMGLAGGSTLVTQPTIAKIGEKGPEMVVPLKARAGNRVQPDVLEGKLSTPKVPGVRYSRYKSFTDRAL